MEREGEDGERGVETEGKRVAVSVVRGGRCSLAVGSIVRAEDGLSGFIATTALVHSLGGAGQQAGH